MTETRFDARMREHAATLAYPPTPDIAGRVWARLSAGPQRRPQRALLASVVAALILCLVLSAVPETRALMLRILRIGVVQIVAPEPTPTSHAAVPSPRPAAASVTPRPTPKPVQDALFPFMGKTTLDAARKSAPFSIPLPSLPADLGQPDLVFLQRQFDEADVVVLIWLDPSDTTRARLSLHLLSKNVLAQKFAPRVIVKTTVDGQPGVWAEGEYPFVLRSGDIEVRRIVDGNTLIWERDGITHRLESRMTLDEARKVAESLR